ncbi:MAG: FtsH protease activity modulator HflK [Acidobacteriota bacterium]
MAEAPGPEHGHDHHDHDHDHHGHDHHGHDRHDHDHPGVDPGDSPGIATQPIVAAASSTEAGPVDERPPLSVRWIHAARDALHERWGVALAILVVALIGGVLAQGIYTVDNGETAALLRFGRVIDDAVGPGLHLRIPGVDTVVKARTGEVFRLSVEGDFATEVQLLTGDENLIETTLVVQYRISDLGAYLFATARPELLVSQAVRAGLVEAFAGTPVDELLTSAKAQVQNDVRNQAQRHLDRYGAGLTIVSVNLQTVNPPREAASAFRMVSDARAEAARKVSEAEAARGRSLRLAEGEAGKMLSEARATADGRRTAAAGAAERFNALLAQKRRSPGQTRIQLYNATIRRVLPAAQLILLPPGETRIDVEVLPPGADVPAPVRYSAPGGDGS